MNDLDYNDLSSPSAESGVIATLLFQPGYLFHAEQLLPSDFADPNNAAIMWGISELAHNGVQSIDEFQLTNILNSNKAAENNIRKISSQDIKTIFELAGYAARHSIEEFLTLVHDIEGYKTKRELYRSAQRLQSACLSGTVDADGLESMLYSMVDNHNVLNNRNKPIEIFGKKMDILWDEQVKRQQGLIKSIPMHIGVLNDFTTLEAGELVLIGAPAKAGKSAFLLSATLDMLSRNMSVLYIDSELDDRIFLLRMIANLAHVEFKKVKDGLFNEEERRRINEAKEWLRDKKLYHVYIPVFSEAEIMSTFRRVNCIDKVECLVVDYIKMADPSVVDAFSSSYKLAGIVNTIKNRIAGEFEIPVLGAVQTTNSGDVALSKGVVRYCSTLFTLRRKTQEEIASDGGKEFGNTYCTCQFNRNGKQQDSGDAVSIQFDGDFCSYHDAEKQPVIESPY